MPSPRTSTLTPKYRYNEDAGRYVDARGRFVPQARITSAFNRQINASRKEMLSLAQQLQEEKISLQEWRMATIAEMKTLHIASGALAKGGWAQMEQADWGRVGGKLRYQIERLDRMASQIQYGTQPLDGRFTQRVQMYANAARGTFTETEREDKRERGFMEERRVLGQAEHCDDCVEYAGLGWQPIGTLPRIGDSQCLTQCKCRFDYR